MQFGNKLLFSILTGSAIFMSCERLGEGSSEQGAIEFATEVGTKALINSASDATFTSRGIGLFGSNAAGSAVFGDNTPLTYSDSKWEYASSTVGRVYWADSDSYRFAAVWPYSTSDAASSRAASYDHATGVLSINCDAGITKSANDLMYDNVTAPRADYVVNGSDGKPASYRPVALNMKHAFAAVQFRVVNASGEAINNGKKVRNPSLTGIEYKGHATVAPASTIAWTLSGTKNTNDGGYSNTKEFEMASSAAAIDFYDDWLTVLPQAVAGTDIKFGFWDGKRDVSCYLRDADSIPRWEPGKKYTYTMTITSTSITFTVTVKEWFTHEYDL